MKISKVELRRIIKEELAKLTEYYPAGAGVHREGDIPFGGHSKPPVSLDYPNTSAVKADVPSTGGRRAGEKGPKGTPSIPTDQESGVIRKSPQEQNRGSADDSPLASLVSQGPGAPWGDVDAQASVGISGEKEIEGVGTIHGSADLPIARTRWPAGEVPDALGRYPHEGTEFEEPTGPRLSAGYSTKGSTYGLPFGWDIGGDLTMTTGGKAPLLGGEINLSKDIGDYSMKVRNTYGDFDLAKGIQGRMVGASLGKRIGNAYFEAGLDIPKGEGGLPSLDQAKVFLQAGGDLGSLSVITGPDLMNTGIGYNFQLDLIGVGRKLGLIKNNNLEEATLKRWKKLIK